MLAAAALISAALIAAGLLLAAIGVRGRRIDDHPVCRRCRFDLHGLYPGAAACPECGGELRENKVRIGRRRVRRGVLSAGAVLCLLGAPGVGFAAWVGVTGTNWYALAPVSVLAWELRRGGDASKAAQEVMTRMKVGSVSAADAATIADGLLARQGDRDAAWDPGLGDLVEAVRTLGLLDDARWERYLLQSARFDVKVRPVIRTGGPTILHGSISHERLGSRKFGVGHFGRYRVRLVSAQIDGHEIKPHELTWWQPCTSLIEPRSSSHFATAIPTPTKAGRAEIRTTWAAVLLGPDEAPDEFYKSNPQRALELGATERESLIERVLEVEFVEAAAPLVELAQDEAMAAWIRGNASVERCYRQDMGGRERGIWVSLRLPRPPIDLAAELRVRPPGGGPEEEVVLMRLVASASSTSNGFGWHAAAPIPAGSRLEGAERVELVIRGSAQVAEETAEMDRVWGGEVVIPNVPVASSPTGRSPRPGPPG